MAETGQGAQPGAALYRDVIVIGASAGGVEALGKLMAGLPAELPAAVFVVLHVMPTGTSMLPHILTRAGSMPATAGTDGEAFERGHVYVSPPDRHMLLKEGTIKLTRGPRENGHRPAVDPLFRSAARTFNRRVIGIVLSGMLDDGTAGVAAVARRGGVTIVQDPADAVYPAMPSSAIAHSAIDHVVPIHKMADLICEILDTPVVAEPPQNDPHNPGPDQVETAPHDPADMPGDPSALTCPDCGGVLWETEEAGVPRFACHVGHVYSPVSLVTEHGNALETAMWTALRSLEERADLFRRLERRVASASARRSFTVQRRQAHEQALLVRAAIERLAEQTAATEETA